MAEIKTEQLYALVSVVTSGLDTRPVGTVQPAISAYLGTMYDFMFKQLNRITVASVTISTGASAQTVTVNFPSAVSGVQGLIQGIPFILSSVSADGLSGTVLSTVSTGSTTIRKVLVGLAFSLPVVSSIAIGCAATSGYTGMVFVYGSAFATSANAVNSGGASTFFNSVPLPKASAGMVPIGWLNIPNNFAVSTALSVTMFLNDYREIQGLHLSLIQGTVQQP